LIEATRQNALKAQSLQYTRWQAIHKPETAPAQQPVPSTATRVILLGDESGFTFACFTSAE
jgi:hypothetical protein